MIKILAIVLLVVILFPAGVYSQETWINYTNANYVNSLAIEGNYIWAATDGGVVKWDMKTGEYIKYTTIDGLAGNEVFSIAIDSEGDKWFGTNIGVSKFDGTNWTTYNDDGGLAGNRVYTYLG